MAAAPLDLALTPSDRPGRFIVTCGSVSYPIEFRPELDVALGDLLRRLQPVLVGGADPAQQLDPITLLRGVGTRLWQAIIPDAVPAPNRDALTRELRSGD